MHRSQVAIAVAFLALHTPLGADLRLVRVHVCNSNGDALSGVILSVQGRTVDVTRNGYTSVALPPEFQPGDSVPLVLNSPKDMYIFPPFSQRLYVPADRPGSEALVTLVRRGEQPSDQTVARRAAEIVTSQNKRTPPSERPSNRDNVATQLGANVDDLNAEIRGLARVQSDPNLKEIVGQYEQDYPYDFAMSAQMLNNLIASRTLQPRLKVNVRGAGPIHRLTADCEMHLAGTLADIVLGEPTGVVIEPPNVCMFGPPEMSTTPLVWRQLVNAKIVGRTCDVSGFPRIFTERGRPIASAEQGPSNPPHFFEIHPAMSIQCASDLFSFEKFLTVFEEMPRSSPERVASCLSSRELQVRYNKEKLAYEFRESGGKCGNWAIVQVDEVQGDSQRFGTSGHRTTATITADGKTRTKLTLYSLAPSAADEWLGQAHGRPVDKWRYVHGMLTYDFRAIADSVKGNPTQWVKVESVFGLVLFGQATKAPWDQK